MQQKKLAQASTLYYKFLQHNILENKQLKQLVTHERVLEKVNLSLLSFIKDLKNLHQEFGQIYLNEHGKVKEYGKLLVKIRQDLMKHYNHTHSEFKKKDLQYYKQKLKFEKIAHNNIEQKQNQGINKDVFKNLSQINAKFNERCQLLDSKYKRYYKTLTENGDKSIQLLKQSFENIQQRFLTLNQTANIQFDYFMSCLGYDGQNKNSFKKLNILQNSIENLNMQSIKKYLIKSQAKQNEGQFSIQSKKIINLQKISVDEQVNSGSNMSKINMVSEFKSPLQNLNGIIENGIDFEENNLDFQYEKIEQIDGQQQFTKNFSFDQPENAILNTEGQCNNFKVINIQASKKKGFIKSTHEIFDTQQNEEDNFEQTPKYGRDTDFEETPQHIFKRKQFDQCNKGIKQSEQEYNSEIDEMYNPFK